VNYDKSRTHIPSSKFSEIIYCCDRHHAKEKKSAI
jgi:hypothetical protein